MWSCWLSPCPRCCSYHCCLLLWLLDIEMLWCCSCHPVEPVGIWNHFCGEGWGWRNQLPAFAFSFRLFLILGDAFLSGIFPDWKYFLVSFHSWKSDVLGDHLADHCSTFIPSCFQYRSWFQSSGFVWMRAGLLIHSDGFLGSGFGKRYRISFDTKLGHPQLSL